jgi:hypothetical protein
LIKFGAQLQNQQPGKTKILQQKKTKRGSVRRCQIGFHIIIHQERMDDSSGTFKTRGKHRENALPTTRDFKLIIHLEAIDDSSN